MNASCASFHARIQECKPSSSQRNPVFHLCCKDDKAALTAFLKLPSLLLDLLDGTTEEAKQYHNFIRAYNSAFSFTSSGANFDRSIADNHVSVYTILEKIHYCLTMVNPFVRQFQANNKEALLTASTQEFELRFGKPSIPDKHYDQPTGFEIAVLMPGDGKEGDGTHSIVLRKRGGGLQFVNQLSGNYDPLHFVLLFPYEYVVDANAKVEESRLHWIRCIQVTLRACLYQGLIDQVATDDVDELLHLIIDKEIFGKLNGRVYVVKFQKRGLPHAHMLWVPDGPYKPKTPKDIDKIVCAELPDPNDQELFDCVETHMIHGPCGSTNPRYPCMKEGKCSKKFPKEFIGWTQLVKYLYKYVYKGHDRIQARVSSKYAPIDIVIVGTTPNTSSHDEAQHMQKMYPTMYALQVHDENMPSVVYVEGEPVSEVMDRSERTPLTEWMRYNMEHPQDELAKQTLVHFVCPSDNTRYYLWLMLHHVLGATCYEDLCTVDDVVYDTYQRAAATHGLLHSDAEFHNNLALASGVASPCQLCELFAMMLLYCEISQPVVLFEKYLEAMSEDIRFENIASQVTNQIQQKVLSTLELILYHNGSSLAAFLGLPQSIELQSIDIVCRPSNENNILNVILVVEHLQGMLNQEQRQLYDAVLEAIESKKHAKEAKVFFVDGPDRSRKTFLYSALLAKMKASRLTAISTARFLFNIQDSYSCHSHLNVWILT
ncbi:uncharacterized protein LOC144702538 [Wolffia australiana]